MLAVVGLASGVCGGLAVALSWLAPGPIIEIVAVVVAGVVVLGFETIIALRMPCEAESATADSAAPPTSAMTATEATGGSR
jgi:uncharacterized membrane protein SpoIIM required for sporulation